MEKEICIITGACGEIGKACTEKFIEENYHVILADVNEEALESLKKEFEKKTNDLSIYKTDISKEDDVKTLISDVEDKYGQIDALVNTAGICGSYAETEEYDFDNFRKIYEVNVFGTFLMMKYVIPLMKERNKGSIVNLGSVSGMRGYKYEIGYGSSKWAVIGMSKNAAAEYGESGIRINTVSPGWVNTGMMLKTLENYRKIGIKDCSEPSKLDLITQLYLR